MKETKVISAFPACGKTYYYESQKDSEISVLDSDSSQFKWRFTRTGRDSESRDTCTKVRNEQFPQNYINHIVENISKVDYILVSSHKEVRRALDNAGVDYFLVFPDRSFKAEWVGRCFLRGSSESFCRLIADNWDDWMDELYEDSTKHQSLILKSDVYLSDVIPYLDHAFSVNLTDVVAYSNDAQSDAVAYDDISLKKDGESS